MGRNSSTHLTDLRRSSYTYHIPPDNNDRFWKGPRKVCSFCLLAVFLPCGLVSLALLMRFVVHGTALYHMAPSDMRILDHRISTIWCQAEKVKGNVSFNAYLTHGEPELMQSSEPVVLERNIIIPDDHKEYWGFYLLKGSSFKVYTCAKFKGGTLLVVLGRNHLEHCAYIGESDSAGNSDELSGSNSVELQNKTRPHASGTISPSSNEEMGALLTKIRQYIRSRPKNYGRLKHTLSNWMLLDPNAVNLTFAEENLSSNNTVGSKIEHGTLQRSRRAIETRKDSESGENGAFEEMDNILESSTTKPEPTSHSIWSQEHGHHHGILNDQVSPNDGSNSESESSWSSSEEAMAKCEGVLGNFQLKANDSCGGSDGFDNSTVPFFEGIANISGYYYFIFGSENEKRDNVISAVFQLDKFIYDLPSPLEGCVGVKECSVNLTFASNEKLVITIPQPGEESESAWNLEAVAESECVPRTHLYLVFVLLVPLVILCFAFQ